jgi:hypothetical protein
MRKSCRREVSKRATEEEGKAGGGERKGAKMEGRKKE